MSLYTEWNALIEDQNNESFQKFWKSYSEAETKIYTSILETPGKVISGTFGELQAQYAVDPVLFMGFLDGIQTSLKESFPLEDLDENSNISLDIDMEKLYFNMLNAEADYLYQLPGWEGVLSPEKRKEITTAYKKSKTFVKAPEPGRNDPCPCGSGKKYKKCCGAK